MFEVVRDAVTKLLGQVLLASQLDTFIAVVTGLLVGEQAGISKIGYHLPGDAKEKSKKNRVYRFVSNPRVRVESVCNAIIGGLGMLGKTVVVATDWTEIGPLSVLTSAVVTDGRAIPIYWTVIDTVHTRKGAVEVKHMFELSQMLAGINAIHVLDRGFDGGEFLESIGGFCKYVVRLAKGFKYQRRDEATFKKINDFDMKRGRRHDLGEVLYTDAHKTRCRIVVIHDHLQAEPWILGTNCYGVLRGTIIEYYGMRFRIEESFKDLKDLRSGFALHGYRMEIPQHLSVLLAVVAVGYLLVSASGHYGEEHGQHRKLQSNTRKERELATWRVGLHCLWRITITADQVIEHSRSLPLHLPQKGYQLDAGGGQPSGKPPARGACEGGSSVAA